MPSAIFISPFTPQASGADTRWQFYPFPATDLADAALPAITTSTVTYNTMQEWYSKTIDIPLALYRGVLKDILTEDILSEYIYNHNGDPVVWGSDTNYIPPLISSLGINVGTGARTVTVTVTDGTNPLENATVRFTQGAETYVAPTDASGNRTFWLNDFTWAVVITKANYTPVGTTLVVDGNKTPSYTMNIIAPLTPSTGDFTTGFLTVYDEQGNEEEGSDIYAQFVSPPDSDTGIVYDSNIRSRTSPAGGLVQFDGLAKGATYRFWRGSPRPNTDALTLVIPANAGGTYELPSFFGKDA